MAQVVFRRRIGAEALEADHLAAIHARAEDAVPDARQGRFDVADFTDMPVDDGEVEVGQRIADCGIARVGRNAADDLDVLLVLGSRELVANFFEQRPVGVLEVLPECCKPCLA